MPRVRITGDHPYFTIGATPWITDDEFERQRSAGVAERILDEPKESDATTQPQR